MRFAAGWSLVLLSLLPAAAQAQYAGGRYAEARTPSVIRQAGHAANHLQVPDGPCGCAMPVRCDNYSNCCKTHCCLFNKIGRILGAMLPCNKCCGPFRCAGCCSAGYPGHYSPSCTSCTSGMPGLSDPFQDDPVTPPTPTPTTNREENEVRHLPSFPPPQRMSRDPRPNSQARSATPYMKTIPATTTPRRATTAPANHKMAGAAPVRATRANPNERSVLRRASVEEKYGAEPLAEWSESAETAEPAPIVMPAEVRLVPVPTEAAETDDYWAVPPIPSNPLR